MSVFLNRRIPVDKRFNDIDDKIRQLCELTASLESRKNEINVENIFQTIDSGKFSQVITNRKLK